MGKGRGISFSRPFFYIQGMENLLCRDCGKNKRAPDGGGRLKAICSSCRKRKYYPNENRRLEVKRRPWLKHRKDKCERCGFVPEHECQLDVDHIDGNRKNNDPSNYQTLCANCHRLKTFRARDWEK